MAQPDTDWPLWITAGATALTAILTGTGGIAAWLALRRERQREMPVVERSLRWRDDHILLSLTVRNRLHEVLTLDSVTITKPSRSTVSPPHGKSPNGYDAPEPPVRGERSILECNYSVNPYGHQSTHSGGDTAYWSFALWPPADWSGGKLAIVLRISSKAETIRNRRIVIKSRMPAAPKSTTDDSANSAD